MAPDPEVLKLGILFGDIINGIVHEFGNIIVTSASVVISGYLALILTGVFLVIAGIAYLIFVNGDYLKNTKDSIQIKAASVVISVFVFLGTLLYFIGDNLPSLVEQINGNDVNVTVINDNSVAQIFSIRPSILVLAVLMWQVIPYSFGKVIEKWPNKDKQNAKDEKLDETYSSVFKEAVYASAMTIDFEFLFTVIQRPGTCSQIQLALVWTVWVVLFTIYGSVLIARVLTHVHTTQKKWSRYLVGIITGILLLTAFGLYLLGDNMQPLDCYQDLSNRAIIIIQLCFLCVSLLLFVIPIVSYPLVKYLVDRKSKETVTPSTDIELKA